MSRPRLTFAILLAAGGVAAVAAAAPVYVPVPGNSGVAGSSHVTNVWLSNADSVERPYSTFFIAHDADGTQRTGAPAQTPIPLRRTFVLGQIGTAGVPRLLEIEPAAKVAVEARLTSTWTAPAGTSTAAVPVISGDNLIAAGATAHLLGLRRDDAKQQVLDFALVNLDKTAAQCQVKFYRADGTAIGGAVSLAFKPLSFRYFTDALATMGERTIADARVEVSCDRPFYPFAVLFTPQEGQTLFITPAATGAGGVGGGGGSQDPIPANAVVFRADGLLHTPTAANEKRKIAVPVTQALNLRRMIVEMDFVRGPWNTVKDPNNHALIWVHRGSYRSNTIVNVNAFGPSKFTVKLNQNVDLPAGNITNGETAVTLEQGKRYHVRYVYDAERAEITCEVSQGGQVVATVRTTGTAAANILKVPATGLVAEFGHYSNQHALGPEVASYGWSYYDLLITMIPY